MAHEHRVCARCIMDTSVPSMRFDDTGTCNLCHVQDRLDRAFFSEQDPDKRAEFERMVARIKADGRGKPFDCIVPYSGGGDSSYALARVCDLGLRPVAYHFDNGWVSDLARENIARVTGALDVPVKTISYPWDSLKDAYLACLRASIPELCLPCLVAVFSLAYKAAEREGVRHVIFSSSPITEGVAPISWSYVDGRYLRSVLRAHGRPETLAMAKDYDRLRISRLAAGTLLRRTKVIMLPLYLEWNDGRIKQELQERFGWQDGGKHADCVYTNFRNYVIWKKFGFDLRKLGPAAQVRAGRVSRARVLSWFQENPVYEDRELNDLVLARLGLDRPELERILAAEPRSFRDYGTYYPLVRMAKPLIRQLSRRGLLAEHVYDKYFEL